MVRPINEKTGKRVPGGMTLRKRWSRKRWCPPFSFIRPVDYWPWPDNLEGHIALHAEKHKLEHKLGENGSYDDLYIPSWGDIDACPYCYWRQNSALDFPYDD
jgi:hypothetical protein